MGGPAPLALADPSFFPRRPTTLALPPCPPVQDTEWRSAASATAVACGPRRLPPVRPSTPTAAEGMHPQGGAGGGRPTRTRTNCCTSGTEGWVDTASAVRRRPVDSCPRKAPKPAGLVLKLPVKDDRTLSVAARSTLRSTTTDSKTQAVTRKTTAAQPNRPRRQRMAGGRNPVGSRRGVPYQAVHGNTRAGNTTPRRGHRAPPSPQHARESRHHQGA